MFTYMFDPRLGNQAKEAIIFGVLVIVFSLAANGYWSFVVKRYAQLCKIEDEKKKDKEAKKAMLYERNRILGCQDHDKILELDDIKTEIQPQQVKEMTGPVIIPPL